MVADFNKKGNSEFFTDKLLFKTVGIIFLAIIFVLFIADLKMYQKKKELAAQIVSYQEKIENIKKSSQTLKEEIANSDNKDYLEKIAYEQLGQIKSGEKEYIFIEPQKQQAETVETKSWPAWLSGAWQWIKSKF